MMEAPPTLQEVPKVPAEGLVQQTQAPRARTLTALGKVPRQKQDTEPSQPDEAVLRWGSWPLMCPGRRDWEAGPSIDIPPPSSIEWPPRNWSSLPPAQRRFAVQAVAAILSLQDQPTGHFPTATPNALAEDYSMLMLPKSGQEAPSGHLSAARYSIHSLLRHTQGPQDKAVHDGILQLLRPTPDAGLPSRQRVLKQVDAAGVPVLPYYRKKAQSTNVAEYDPTRPGLSE